MSGAPPRCLHCLDDGHVCEDHPAFPWEGLHGTVEGHAEHGGIGMPCSACCPEIPADGTRSIAEAFTPDWQRQLHPRLRPQCPSVR
jgi:hypothetical protein